MAAMGILGEYKGSQAREVVMTLEQYEEAKNQVVDRDAMTQSQTSYENVDGGNVLIPSTPFAFLTRSRLMSWP